MGLDGVSYTDTFKRGYYWKHFVNPEAAWATLEEVRKKPDAVVADYYLSGGEMNGLKVVRQAQRLIPGIWTVLATWFAEEHIRGIMERTNILPDLFFHVADYGWLDHVRPDFFRRAALDWAAAKGIPCGMFHEGD